MPTFFCRAALVVALVMTADGSDAFCQENVSVEPAVKSEEYPRPLSSAEMAEREWLARQEFKTTVFFSIAAIATVALIAAFVLPAVVRRRKSAVSRNPPTNSSQS